MGLEPKCNLIFSKTFQIRYCLKNGGCDYTPGFITYNQQCAANANTIT